MGLFKKHQATYFGEPVFTPLGDELQPVANYESTLDYLVGLSKDEYAQIVKVADIYRKANQDAAAALGTPNTPTTFIKAPEKQILDDIEKYIDRENEDDDIPFIQDEDLKQDIAKPTGEKK